MSIFVIGINHKTASVSVREKVYFNLDNVTLYLRDLLSQGYAREAVLLSTCNRSDLYCETDCIEAVFDWYCEQTSASRSEIESAIYIYKDDEAIGHIMEVACGLDSMVVGEPQILGQMKQAFAESCTVEAANGCFQRLFQQIFALAKEIRTTTSIGACPVSVASAAVHFAKQHVADFAEANVVLIGAGDTPKLLLRYLKSQLVRPIKVVNRSIENAAQLTDEFGGNAYGLESLAAALATADIVFSATGSAVPVVQKELVSEAMQARINQAMVMIDIAVPRDIEPSVGELANVKLFCIDDLKSIIEKNRQGREHAGDKAREMIYKKSLELLHEVNSVDKVAHTIRAYRGQIEDICRAELLKAKHQLHQGMDPSQVLDIFASAFTKKLLHAPSVQLRQAGAEGRFEILTFAKQLFAIPDTEVEMYEAINRN